MNRFLLASRITPKLVWAGLTGEVLLLSALYLPAALGLSGRFRLAEAIVMTVSGLLAYGIAMLLSLEIAAEYRRSPWARAAWLLLAASAAISLLKRTAGTPLLDFVITDYRISPLRGLVDNLLVTPANLCLLAGLLALWWALHRIGLGFKIELRDWAAMAGMTALFLTMLIFRKDLSQGNSPYQVSRILQPFSLALLGLASAFGVVLHRYAVQMGDGRLAAVMRWLMLYVVLRGALALGRGLLSPTQPLLLDSPSDINAWTLEVLWQIVHWAAAMATACRAQLTVSAAEELRKLRAAKAAAVSI
ncbi:MAG TPA: hypothetical protein PLK30_16680 [Blastocatellia bacterium]|nr:hypothetical protein [Blastocatellia bacterium]